MTEKTLFLAWQDKDRTRQWFPIGRLDVDRHSSLYHFRYLKGAKQASDQSGFEALDDFPDLYKDYSSSELFPLFQNRVLAPGRRDFHAYLKMLDLPEEANPIEILSVDGGFRATDSFEVFPKIERLKDGAFRCRFFLHGSRHANLDAQRKLESLANGEQLYVAIELTNPATKLAIPILTTDYHLIGWAPRYLVKDLVKAIAQAPGDYKAKVVKVNPIPSPSKQRLLVELSGHWPENYEPMSSEDYLPISN